MITTPNSIKDDQRPRTLDDLKKKNMVQDPLRFSIAGTIYLIFWLLPFTVKIITKYSHLKFLEKISYIPIISIPLFIICLFIFFLIFGILIQVWQLYSHYTYGGAKNTDETIIFYVKGPYRIIRHPGWTGFIFSLISLPIILSPWIPFTLLAIGSIITVIIWLFYRVNEEDKKLNIPKFGDTYKKYMKEVPAINIIKGLWNLKRQKANQ